MATAHAPILFQPSNRLTQGFNSNFQKGAEHAQPATDWPRNNPQKDPNVKW